MLNIPIEVQDALREGALRKNYKMKVNDVDPDTGERTYLYTIDNDSLVSESVKIDERMVTGKQLKFGLCEGSSLEFQYFDHPNINGKDVQVYCSVEYVDGNGDVAWYDIPMGWYTVDQCPMQWDTGIYKVTAYNKLKSKYLDAKANSLIEVLPSDGEDNKLSIYTILQSLLQDYSIEDVPRYGVIDFALLSQTAWTDASATFKTIYDNYTYYTLARNIQGSFRTNYTGFQYDLFPYEGVYLDFGDLSEFYRQFDEIIMGYGLTQFNNRVQNPDTALTKLVNRGDMALAFSIEISIWNTPYDGYTHDYLYTHSQFVPPGGSGGYIPSDIIRPFSELPQRVFNVARVRVKLSDIQAYREDSQQYAYTQNIIQTQDLWNSYGDDLSDLVGSQIFITFADDLNKLENTRVDWSSLPDVTLRELQSSVYESACKYGQLDRETDLFSGVELNQGGLYPADTLYPDDALYPLGTMEHPFPSTYSKLWTDTVGEQSFRYLIITYKAMENGQEVEKKLQRTVNEHGTTNYNMSDNWLFRNLVWSDADVGDYADAMVLKMKDIRWFPFEMWCAGLPYVETGDAIEITDRQGDTHTSYVLTRTLDGIHNLQDTFINGELDIF